MKNRLQIRYHFPELKDGKIILPTRDEALEYIRGSFARNTTTNHGNASLIAEPLVLFYNDNTNLMQDEILSKSNVILAIGRGGNGNDILTNEDYFIIDFAKHDEDIKKAFSEITSNDEDIANIFDMIDQIKNNVAINFDNINAINTKIGDVDDNPKFKDTIYGYINGAYNKIDLFKLDVDTLTNQIDLESKRAIGVEETLKFAINDEKTERVVNHAKLEEALQNTASELMNKVQLTASELTNKIEDESDKASANLQQSVQSLTEKYDTKTSELEKYIVSKVNEVDGKINKEVKDRTDDINNLRIEKNNEINNVESLISGVSINLNSEITTRSNEIARLESKINTNTDNINKNKVSSSSKTININAQESGTTDINVNIDNETLISNGGILSVKVSDDDKILSTSDKGLLTTLSLKWVKKTDGNEADEIQLIGKNDNVISRINVDEFLKNGMLSNVVLDTTNPTQPVLKFTFNTDAGEKVIELDVSQLVELYHAGIGLTQNENTFSIKIDNTSESYLTVGQDGLKLTGINNYVNSEIGKVNSNVTERVAELSKNIETNRVNIEGVKSEYKAEDTRIEQKIKDTENSIKELINNNYNVLYSGYTSADAQIKLDYVNADNLIKTELENADALLSEQYNTLEANVNAYIETLRTEFGKADNQIIVDYKNADNLLKDEVNQKIYDSENTLNDRITNLQNTVSTNHETINTELSNRYKELNLFVQEKIDESRNYANGIVEQEYQRAIEIEDYLKTQIANNISATELISKNVNDFNNNLNTQIINETNRAIGAESELSTRIDRTNDSINVLNASVNERIDTLITNVNGQTSALSTRIDAEIQRATTKENELGQNITNVHSELKTQIINLENTIVIKHDDILKNAAAIEKLNDDVNRDGSIRDIIYDSIVGTPITTVTPDTTAQISLIKKYQIDGMPYIYASNSTADMMHNGNNLSELINTLINRIETLEQEVSYLKQHAIIKIEGTENEIAVNTSIQDNGIGNVATIKFADDAYFVAGV